MRHPRGNCRCKLKPVLFRVGVDAFDKPAVLLYFVAFYRRNFFSKNSSDKEDEESKMC